MKTIPVILLCFLAVFMVACGKDKFETKPLLKIKDYTSKNVSSGEQLRIRINYFDKEGDLSQCLFVARRVRLNLKPLGTSDNDKADILDTPLPEFPAKDKGEISFTQKWDFLKESTTENDTLVFRFAVTDKAGNASDTITSDPIVVYLP